MYLYLKKKEVSRKVIQQFYTLKISGFESPTSYKRYKKGNSQVAKAMEFESMISGSNPDFLKIKICEKRNMIYIINIINIIIIIVSVLISLAYLTIAERKLMASMQRRVGPNVIGIYGLGQPILDGVKLILKEGITPIHANKWIYNIAPIGSLILALVL
jgi:hypothetical protein